MAGLGTLVLSLPRISFPSLELLMQYPGTLVLSLSRITWNTGRLRDFSSGPNKNIPTPPKLELLMEYLGTLVLSLSRILPPTHTKWYFSWRTLKGTGAWRLISVSHADIVSLNYLHFGDTNNLNSATHTSCVNHKQ